LIGRYEFAVEESTDLSKFGRDTFSPSFLGHCIVAFKYDSREQTAAEHTKQNKRVEGHTGCATILVMRALKEYLPRRQIWYAKP